LATIAAHINEYIIAMLLALRALCFLAFLAAGDSEEPSCGGRCGAAVAARSRPPPPALKTGDAAASAADVAAAAAEKIIHEVRRYHDPHRSLCDPHHGQCGV
jgi:hypothetical protein